MRIEGILPAAITPVDPSGRFQPGVYEELLNRFYHAGVDGVYVCGSTGEGLRLRASERMAAVETAIRYTPSGKIVLAHIGAASTGEALELARHAAGAGVHALSSLAPVGAYSFGEIKAYFAAIASATPVPLVIYYTPSVWGGTSSLDQILELCEIPGVIGLKFTDADMYQLHAIRRAGHVVFHGRDEMLAAGLLMGASGGIGSTYNLVPEAYVAMRRAALAGNWTEVVDIQTRVNEFIRVLLRYPFPSVIKTVLKATGLDAGDSLPPQRALTAAERDQLFEGLAATALGARFAAGA